mmetsp:Transcript_28382/g.67543  ORF Transcript_28382/g.67543 Transcript_28382/m.67543 type:complete len:266 (+) Transcript_28382:201-998(+)
MRGADEFRSPRPPVWLQSACRWRARGLLRPRRVAGPAAARIGTRPGAARHPPLIYCPGPWFLMVLSTMQPQHLLCTDVSEGSAGSASAVLTRLLGLVEVPRRRLEDVGVVGGCARRDAGEGVLDALHALEAAALPHEVGALPEEGVPKAAPAHAVAEVGVGRAKVGVGRQLLRQLDALQLADVDAAATEIEAVHPPQLIHLPAEAPRAPRPIAALVSARRRELREAESGRGVLGAEDVVGRLKELRARNVIEGLALAFPRPEVLP